MSRHDLQNRFLDVFPSLFPQLKFRGIKQVRKGALGPFGFVLRVTMGSYDASMDLECITLNSCDEQDTIRLAKDLQGMENDSEVDGLVPTIIAPSLSSQVMDICTDSGLSYMLLDGNALLQSPQIYFCIRTVTESALETRADPDRKLLTGKAERIARTLILNPDRKWTMRELAAAAGVSLGLASTASSSFAQAGWVHKGASGLTLRDGVALLNALSEKYDLMRNSYRMYRTNEDPEQILGRVAASVADGMDMATTLWTAASAYLDTPVGAMTALYANQTPDATARQFHLGQEGQTVVFVFQPYDDVVLENCQDREGVPVVNPLQLYLDLACGDEKEYNLAQLVRTELLAC